MTSDVGVRGVVLGEEDWGDVPSENEETVGPDFVAFGCEVSKFGKESNEGVEEDKAGLEAVGWIEGARAEEVSREVEFSWKDEALWVVEFSWRKVGKGSVVEDILAFCLGPSFARCG